MDEEELDEILQVLSNPTRRKILAKLVQERHYPLQLSKELRISQQAITKHLRVLESYGIVESVSMPSSEGPPRKLYRTTKHFTVTISMDPKVFDARATETGPVTGLMPEETQELEGDFKTILHTQNYKDRVRKITALLQRTEEEVRELDRRRAIHLQLKSRMLKEAYALISELYPDYGHRAVLYLLLEAPEADVETIARELQMAERDVVAVLDDLRMDDILPGMEGGRKERTIRVRVRKRGM